MTRPDRHRLHAWIVLLGLLTAGSTARAMPAETVVLVRSPADHGRWRPAEARTRDELRVMGMAVVEVEVAAEAAAIERALAEHGARVAVHVVREGDVGGAEVWCQGPDGAGLETTRIEGLATEGRAAAAVAALRAAELVRARTLPGTEEAGAGDRSPGVRPGDEAGVGDRLSGAGAERAGGDGAGAGDRSSGARPGEGAGAGDRFSRARPGGAGGAGGIHRDGARDMSRDVGVVPAEDAAARPDAGARDRSLPASARPKGAPAGAGAGEAAPIWAGVIDPLEVVEAPPPAAPKPAVRDDAAGDRAVGAFAGVGGGPGGAGALLGGGLVLRGHVTRRLALAGELQGATSPVWLSGQEHSLRVGLAGAHAGLVFVARREARVSFRLGLGGGATLAWAVGRAREGNVSRARVLVATICASGQAALRVRPHLRVVAGVDVELLAPPVAVRVQGAEAARVGTPLLRGVLGLEWDWSSRGRR